MSVLLGQGYSKQFYSDEATGNGRADLGSVYHLEVRFNRVYADYKDNVYSSNQQRTNHGHILVSG